MRRKLNSVGDTIVEVLIATSVIGVILVGGYVTTDYELTADRQSQERGEVVQLEKSQLEELEALADSGKIVLNPSQPGGLSYTTKFCITNAGGSIQTIPSKCNFSGSGAWGATQTSPYFYNVYIKSTTGSDWNNVQATASWTAAGGNEQDSATLNYRFYVAN